jgi:hypothetical protein
MRNHSQLKQKNTTEMEYSEIEPLLNLMFCELQDEAAVQIAAFLYELASQFESRRVGQILRYRNSQNEQNSIAGPRQLELFPKESPF